jgi:ATP-binding cassette subfamily F protein 3
MSLIAVNNLSLSFSGQTIFDKVGFQINNEDRIGLVGPNGTGKTTLLRILIGEISPDGGEVSKTRGVRIGYLPQDISRMSKGTLFASVLNSIPGKPERDQRLKKLEIDLDQTQDHDLQTTLAHQMADLHHEIDYYNTRFSPHKAEQILLGLGFSAESFDAPLNELSGGWKMRAALAELLFQEPDVLLLDEPTNHLDLPSVLWLEKFFLNFNHSLVLICHDRQFINNQVNRVISLEPEGLRNYTGNYDAYLAARREEESVLEKRALNQEQQVKEAKRFIERFRSKATKARQAQSKIKTLKKLEIVKTYKKRKVMHFSFPEVPRSGDVVLSIQGLTKSFGGRHLYQDLDLAVKRGERIAVIGKNGAGKTTLLKMIAGEISPDRGTIHFGHNVTMSHYAQHHTELLNENSTILEEVSQIVPNAGISFVRGVCGAFLFPGDDVEKPISVLSGGEKARVALARILVKPGNLMLMDEPTNHLDLLSSEVLAKALRDYNGTLVFVSHNQSLINSLATKIWDVADQKVEEYPGSLEEYIDHLDRNKNTPQVEAGEQKSADKSSTQKDHRDKKTAKEQRRIKAERRKLISQKLGPIKKELAKLERRIDELEKREKTVSRELSDPKIYQDIQQSEPLMIEYSKVKMELGELLKKWEYQQEMLEAAQKEL